MYLTKYKISSSTICITALPLTTWILENLSKLIKNHYWSSSQRKNFGSLHNWSEITNSLKSKLEYDKQITLKKTSKNMKGLQFKKKLHPPQNILKLDIQWELLCIYFFKFELQNNQNTFSNLKNMSVINSKFWKITLTDKYPQREVVCKLCRY